MLEKDQGIQDRSEEFGQMISFAREIPARRRYAAGPVVLAVVPDECMQVQRPVPAAEAKLPDSQLHTRAGVAAMSFVERLQCRTAWRLYASQFYAASLDRKRRNQARSDKNSRR